MDGNHGSVLHLSVVLVILFFLATCFKVLLIPSYRSTDFEVHRNWLAITHSLPLSQWYYEATSQWTLDYPPFFAWFEYLLSLPASLVDPVMVNIRSLDYEGHNCVVFQRFSVIASDITLLYAMFQYYCYQRAKFSDQQAFRKSVVVSLFVLLNYGLFVVDHIHFQYNGFLFGIMLLSVVRILQGRYVEGGFWFAVLLNFKHIFLYLAPAFFLYLLKHYCFTASKSPLFLPRNFIKLGGVVTGVFLLSFGPFIYLGQLGQVLSRLFPFKRGLCHAYWAPNFWALYSVVDIVMAFVGQRLGFLSGTCEGGSNCGSMTSGLVGEMSFKVLPNVTPWLTLLLTFLAMLPGLLRMWLRPKSSQEFLTVIIVCAFSSFLFGWHVHEKAVLLVTIPMSMLAVEDDSITGLFLFLSMAAHVSLFPLLHQAAETGVKLSLFVFCTCMSHLSFGGVLSVFPLLSPHSDMSSGLSQTPPNMSEPSQTPPNMSEPSQTPSKMSELAQTPSNMSKNAPSLLSSPQYLYSAFLLLVQFYCIFLHGFGPLRRYEFLPLLLTSVTCALAVVLSWAQFLVSLILVH